MKTEHKIAIPTLFSIEQLNKIGNNDEGFTNKMIAKFSLLASECSKDLWEALNNSDWSKLRSICHKNIPPYALLELNDIVTMLKFIETNAELEPENVTKFVGQIYIKNNEVIKAINEYLSLRTNEKNTYIY